MTGNEYAQEAIRLGVELFGESNSKDFAIGWLAQTIDDIQFSHRMKLERLNAREYIDVRTIPPCELEDDEDTVLSEGV